MDEKPVSSSWDDLIQQLGVQPAPDALERRRPAIESQFDAPPAAPAPVAKPKPGNWSALASELGVEVPKEPPAHPATAPVAPGAIEASFAAIEPLESGFQEIIEEEIADVEFAEADDDGPLFEDDDSDVDDSSVIDEDELSQRSGKPTGERDDPLPPSALSGEAARSAFEALFQAGATGGAWSPPPPPPRTRREPVDDLFDDFAPAARTPGDDASASEPAGEGERRPRRRRRRGRGGRGARDAAERGPASPPPRDDQGDAWTGERGAAADADDAEEAARSDDEPQREGRSRRRRSRRGGRGRSAESAPAGEQRAGGRNGRPERSRPASDDDEADDADDLAALHADPEDDDDGAASSRTSHKSIPSWSEAIGVMVDVNMQARKNSPQRSGGGEARGGRGGRGRGRGGRGRGRSGSGGARPA